MKINETIRQRRIREKFNAGAGGEIIWELQLPQSINGRKELLIRTSPFYLHWQEF